MAGRRARNRRKTENKNGVKHENAGSYDKIVMENKLFEKYYKETGIVPENEWEQFMNIIKQPLPVVFRITSYKSYSNEILKILKEKHFKLINDYLNENKEGDDRNEKQNQDDIYKCLTWYPNEFAWQVNLTRQDVRKNERLLKFKQFLIDQTESGNVSRQEAVSMIPPVLLDVKPHHKILDMCAAPGSKTAQLIEFLHSDENNPVPDGFVVANDIDNKRCYMLVHQLKRLESPNFIIINHDSSVLPNLRYETPDGQIRSISYDRIVCDVPCSGDGTFRKNIDIWKKWNFAHACNLHGIQIRIAQRAVELLASNGLMVYSTCSLNPVENEAVVANLLLKFKDQIELVDARDKLTGLKTVNGFHTWKLMSKDGDIYEKIEQVNDKWKYLIRQHMFPPSPEVAKELKLDRCIRILPHHQNTGGFFIAVIRKLPTNNQNIEAETAATGQDQTEVVNEQSNDTNPPDPLGRELKGAPAKRLKHVYDENPFNFYSEDNKLESWPLIKDFFGIKDDFPIEQLMIRNRKGENVRNVYFVSKYIHDLVKINSDRIKFINMGVKLFSKAEIKDNTNIELKICQEGSDIVYKYFTKRILTLRNYDDLFKLLSMSMPDLNAFSEDFQQEIKNCNGIGSVVIKYSTNLIKDASVNSQDVEKKNTVSFIAWLGKSTMRPFLNVQARKLLLSICRVEDEEINKICDAVRLEDQMNSEKSRVISKNKAENKPTVNEELIEHDEEGDKSNISESESIETEET